MTQQTMSGVVPQLTLGWRLRMALDAGEVSVQAMADQLGVSRATLSRWMGDKGAPPARAYVSQWALITGVPVEWLRTGQVSGADGPDDGGTQMTRGYGIFPGQRVFDISRSASASAPNALAAQAA